MLPSLIRPIRQIGPSWRPLNTSSPVFYHIPSSDLIEEETITGYVAAHYYPTQIREIIPDRYQIVGKLGFGSCSTIWLARDMRLQVKQNVSLKMFIKLKELDKQLNNELEIYNRTSESRRITMAASLSEHYTIQLMLMAPMLNIDVSYILLYLKVLRLPTSRPDPEASSSSPGSRARASVLGIGLSAYMFDVGSDSIFKDIEKQKVEYQIPRKEVDGRTIYWSRNLKCPHSKDLRPILARR
ncbi:hypothetical protein N7508_000734 [Penicillium antarcticum]|uniref:uncharacterized protein n=1 Tax=Penicillium antarcticum TaxID=416450 RepID=UPI0023A35FFF|nr:uncharacterized protein N7508_000734 [Penicillium antarcticum]KAJ5320451.1 hypothetical protein N7508_000734 [Penicillium antarcticum]